MEAKADYKLYKANEVIGRFITSCSHSMRGPLKSIAGLVSLLQTGKNVGETERTMFLDLIAKTSLKMEHMLDELEHFLENTKRDMSVQEIDFDNLVGEVVNFYGDEIGRNQIHVEREISTKVDFHSDSNRLRLILDNLVANAIHFHNPNERERKMLICISSTNAGIQLRVTDNGIGIERNAQSKVFQLFYRASERSGGAGIGLYVVHEVVGKMGGKIVVESDPSWGTSFIIRLPDLRNRKLKKI